MVKAGPDYFFQKIFQPPPPKNQMVAPLGHAKKIRKRTHIYHGQIKSGVLLISMEPTS